MGLKDFASDTSEWPVNGNRYSSLAELFAVKETVPILSCPNEHDGRVRTFSSIHPAYSPGNIERAFGGHVYAQAVVAASKTVAEGFALHVGSHSLTNGFLCKGRD